MQETPTFMHEQRLWAAGYGHVAGVDEAGRGALAGPVVAAAVVVDRADTVRELWCEVRDSKLLAAGRRARLAEQIKAAALAWGIGCVAAGVIDRIGIAAATHQAMLAAIAGLGVRPDYLLIDWVRLPQLNLAQWSQPKADRDMVSVAAASILAKVHRDEIMLELDGQYPAYGFAHHKGYGAPFHLAALRKCGACTEHRRSFAPLAHAPTLFSDP